jgi:NADH:ubiquinone oxidoreductase subunit 3 (subunit A)
LFEEADEEDSVWKAERERNSALFVLLLLLFVVFDEEVPFVNTVSFLKV